MAQITYTDKTALNINSDIADINKVNASDMNEIKNVVNANWNGLLDLIYPIGSIYMSTNSVSPATIIGGTWTQLEDRFLLGSGSTYTAGATGGEATHTLTIDEMPAHTHIASGYRAEYAQSGSNRNTPVSWNSSSRDGQYISSSTGGDQSHNNMPPYLVVYMWERTS